ncbi:hypothetical protein [Streptomyces sp. NPDC093591]|uniref:hypothetical protein n=1 Tax=Streptomyces sp. NPDC093591 TaxID=3366044 RepID=UPI003830DC22
MNLRTARACLAGAALTFTTGAYFATQPSWLCVFGFYGSAFFLWLARCHYAEDRHTRARHERARRAAIVDALLLGQTPVPCCSFWRNSDGAVHGPDCTQPPYARRDDYRLDDTDRAAWQEIAAHWDDRSAA